MSLLSLVLEIVDCKTPWAWDVRGLKPPFLRVWLSLVASRVNSSQQLSSLEHVFAKV